MMKNRIIGGLLMILVGALVAVGPHTLFKICDQSHHTETSNCFWTGQALIGVGIVFALLGIAYLLSRDPRIRVGLSLASGANVVLTFLLANVLIGMDGDKMMACRTATLPALNVISIIAFLLVVINTIYLLRRSREVVNGNADAKTLPHGSGH